MGRELYGWMEGWLDTRVSSIISQYGGGGGGGGSSSGDEGQRGIYPVSYRRGSFVAKGGDRE